jgi:hypothetical protein
MFSFSRDNEFNDADVYTCEGCRGGARGVQNTAAILDGGYFYPRTKEALEEMGNMPPCNTCGKNFLILKDGTSGYDHRPKYLCLKCGTHTSYGNGVDAVLNPVKRKRKRGQ